MRASRLFVNFLAGCAASLAWTIPAHAEDWPTTKFVFHNVNLAVDTPNILDRHFGFSAAQKPVVAQYEKYLSEVAAYYQSLGFKAPPLPTTSFGEKAYIVYLYDYPDSATTALAGFGLREPQILGLTKVDLRVDISRAIVAGKAVDRTFEDLAHELFHNIQRGYQLTYELDHGDWISEGQAQAIGMEAAKKLRGIEVYKDNGTAPNEFYWLGGRRYDWRLTTAVGDASYRTASLWRYIGEHVAAAKANGRAGVARIDPDYRYLAKIYNHHPFKGPVSVRGDLAWLDNALEKEVGLGLDRLYPNFVSTFAAYVPARLSTQPTSAQKAEDTWLDSVYGLCPVVFLATGTPSGAVKVVLPKTASRCFKASISGTGWFDISIQVRADTAQSLAALHIGVSGGTQVSTPDVIVSPIGGGFIGHWRFRVPTAAPQVFIISNMAAEPAKSINQDVVLSLTASQWNSSMTTPTPQAQPQSQPASKPTQGSGRAKSGRTAARDATREANQENLASGLAALSNQTAIGSRAFLNRNIDPCNQPFAVLGCGPNTTIQLALTPGVLGDFSQTSGTGGMVGQFLSNLTAIADNGIALTSAELLAAQQKITATEGAEVSIVIPAIEYGFTGSFGNAHISMSGANGAGGFQTGGTQGDHSGKVTIEEFTPYVLRGRFSGRLTRTSEADYTQVETRTISGSFVVAAPWEGDRDIVVYRSSADPMDSVRQDLNEVIPILGNVPLASPRNPIGQSGSSSSPVSPTAAFPSCSCSCQPIASDDAVCPPICAVMVQQCAAQVTQQAALQESQAKQVALGKLAGDVGRMRADFKAFLRDNNMAHLQETLLASFDQQPTPEAKRFLLFTYGMPVDGYGK